MIAAKLNSPHARKLANGVLNKGLCLGIDAGCRFIEHEDSRVVRKRASEGKKLALTHREISPALPDLFLVSMRELPDEMIGIHRPGGAAELEGDRVALMLDVARLMGEGAAA